MIPLRESVINIIFFQCEYRTAAILFCDLRDLIHLPEERKYHIIIFMVLCKVIYIVTQNRDIRFLCCLFPQNGKGDLALINGSYLVNII